MALPVAELADKDCALFLWITLPKLCEAWGVMEAWGFTYRTTLCLDQTEPQSGHRLLGTGKLDPRQCRTVSAGHKRAP